MLAVAALSALRDLELRLADSPLRTLWLRSTVSGWDWVMSAHKQDTG
jgi:hypothetical protein